MSGLVPDPDTDRRIQFVGLIVIIAACTLAAVLLVLKFRLALP
jgi:hypothetical protein